MNNLELDNNLFSVLQVRTERVLSTTKCPRTIACVVFCGNRAQADDKAKTTIMGVDLVPIVRNFSIETVSPTDPDYALSRQLHYSTDTSDDLL